MSSLSEDWSILPFANRDCGPPKLLFKFITHSNGYRLYVTDLIRCWKDSHTRQSVVKQAIEKHSSIDPSEDASQFSVLLSKLGDGLSGEHGGRCKVGPGFRDMSSTDSLGSFCIVSRTPLPAPLQPLHWTFHLRQAEQMVLTRELLLPALAADLKYKDQIEELTHKINEKDHVIARLMDKIEQSSMDLSLVFPSYSMGRKGLDVKQAVKLVPGISRFDEDGWRKRHEDPMLTTTRSVSELLRKPGSNQVAFDGPRDYDDGDSAWESFGNTGIFNADWTDPSWTDPAFTEDEHPTHTKRRKEGQKRPLRTLTLPVEESSDAFEVHFSSKALVYCTY